MSKLRSLLPRGSQQIQDLEHTKKSLCSLKETKGKQCSEELIQGLESKAKELQSLLQGSQEAGTDSKLAQLKVKEIVNDMMLYTSMLTLDPPIPVRIIDGLPIVYTKDGGQVERLAALSKDVPKALRPILQPMGNAKLVEGFEDDFPYVLPEVAPDTSLNSVPDPSDPILQNIKLEREQALTKDFEVEHAGEGETPEEHVPGQGSVRRLWADAEGRLRKVASDNGNLYVGKFGGALLLGDLKGFTNINVKFLEYVSILGLAVSGNTMVAVNWLKDLFVAHISGSNVEKKFNTRLEGVGCGVSMNESHAYFCVGDSVQCLDLETYNISPVMGKGDQAGCGGAEDSAIDLLLKDPNDTALVGSSLFVADTGKGRVLCYDMKKNKCHVVFHGNLPYCLAADHSNLFIYDLSKDKIFHVDLDTWQVEHVLGTGVRGSSPEGLPPLSTHLGLVRSMAIGHNGELVYIEDSRFLRAFKRVQKEVSDPGALCATRVGLFHEGPGEKSDAVVPLPEFQPTYGAKWQPFHRGTVPMPMFASEVLPKDRKSVSLKFQMAAPSHGLGICLVPDVNMPGTTAPVDSHLISPPDWAAKTFVSTLSAMEKLQNLSQPFRSFRKKLNKCMATFRNFVMNSLAGQETPLGKPFHFRNQNHFEVVVERSYDEEVDCFVWKLVKVLINGKERAGSLDSLIVGVDVGVRVCMFSATDGGSLKFLTEPKIV